MQRISTTVVALVGADEVTTSSIRQKDNVALCQPDPSAAALDRAVTAWELARRTRIPYFVHDADPLVVVANAWAAYFEGTGPLGELEVAVAETVARWRAGSLELPDYYVVSSPEEWPPVRWDWHLGVLAGTNPVRVATVTEPADLVRVLAALPAARWWPPLDELLAGIERALPERAGLPARSGLGTEPDHRGLITPS